MGFEPSWPRLRRYGLRALGTLALVCLSACLHTRHATDYVSGSDAPAARDRIAVLPLENLTNYPRAGLIAAELLSSELYQRGLFDLMEGTALRQALNAAEIEPSDVAVTISAAALATRLGVDAVLIGSVSEYGYQHGLHEEPVVGLNLRLVRANDAEILWASSHSTTGRGYIARDSVNAAAQRLLAEMVTGLEARMREP